MATGPMRHEDAWVLPEVRDPATGRIDARKLAKLLGVEQAQLARALGVDRRLLANEPTLPKLQRKAGLLERTFAILVAYLGSEAVARAWFHAPNLALEGRAAWEVCEDVEAFPQGVEAVARMVERTAEGIPS